MNLPSGLRRRGFVTAAAVGGAALILTLQLLVPPIIGLADNGDFIRVMGLVGLGPVSDRFEDRYFGWVQPRFTVVEPCHNVTGYLTSEDLLAGAAVLASRVFRPGRLFDVRTLGGLHILLLLIAIGGSVTACRELTTPAQWLAAGLLVFCFTDVGYAASINSLYSQTASLLFLLLGVAVCAAAIRRGGLAGGALLAYFACAALFVTSKPQEVIQTPLLALLALRLSHACGRRSFRAAVALAVMLCGLSIWYYRRTAESVRPVSLYHSVFLEVLPHSPEPSRDLAELGLDPRWARYSGVPAFDAASPYREKDFRRRFLAGADHWSVLRLYVRHPRRLFATIERALRLSFDLRQPGLGNFAKEAGGPPGRVASRFSWWSGLRSRLSGLPWLVVPLAGGAFAVVAAYRWPVGRERLFREALLVLISMTTVSFLACALMDSDLDLPRHLYVFHALSDLMLIAAAAWAARSVAARIRSRRPAAEAA